MLLMELVVSRENMTLAYARVVRNKGAAGALTDNRLMMSAMALTLTSGVGFTDMLVSDSVTHTPPP